MPIVGQAFGKYNVFSCMFIFVIKESFLDFGNHLLCTFINKDTSETPSPTGLWIGVTSNNFFLTNSKIILTILLLHEKDRVPTNNYFKMIINSANEPEIMPLGLVKSTILCYK